jgi:SAM-dependent methyltransferase
MNPEIRGNTVEIDEECKRIRERIAPDLELPDAQWTLQSGPFKSAQHFFDSSFQNFKELLYFTGLTPQHRVLDYGCGLGRLSIPMSAYLDAAGGSYCGVDTNASCISRNSRVFGDYENFRFIHANIYSKMYNRQGKSIQELLKHDFGEPFDLAFLFSVFTHILSNDCDFLLKFLRSQLLEPGEIFTSWFLLNDETQSAIDAGQSGRNFEYSHGDARIENKEVPEGAVAYYEQDVLERFKKAGFSDVRVHYGMWRGCVKSWVYQDIIVARV